MSPLPAVKLSGPGNTFGVNVPAGYSRKLFTVTELGSPAITGGETATSSLVAAPFTTVTVG